MSSYLLLRNNKESGPFTIDEIKGMSLKSYDLLWVVGKSAAWRYPGEIAEIKSFAPPVPEQLTGVYRMTKAENLNTGSRETNSQKAVTPVKTIYVNLPSEKKQVIIQRERVLTDQDFSEKHISAFYPSDLNHKNDNGSVRFSGRILWISAIIMLFGAGLLTGFVISDRGKYFSKDDIHQQTGHLRYPSGVTSKKEILLPVSEKAIADNTIIQSGESASILSDPLKTTNQPTKKNTAYTNKKYPDNGTSKKDTSVVQKSIVLIANPKDSLKKNASDNTVLYQKIKSHPENYIDLVTGRYSIGVFGGISGFPVTVTNNSIIVMDQVIISIDYIQNNEKIFKTENICFTGLEPGETVTMRAPKSPRGVKVVTHIRIVNSAIPDTSYSN
jgi:hypothetical protein